MHEISAAKHGTTWPCAIALAGALLQGCGQSPEPRSLQPDPPPAELVCRVDALSEADILAVARPEPDAPLATLAHYAPRSAVRAPDATLNSGACTNNTQFRYAAGRGDITGPIGANMAGYVDTDQISNGLLDRQHARAFIIETACSGASERVVLVQMDIGLMFHSIRQTVLDRLAEDPVLGPLYTDSNLLMNASHSHATAAGQSHFDAYHVLTLGHDAQALEHAVSGVINAITRAHRALQEAVPGPIRYNQGELLNGTVNRSIEAYAQNPADERAAFVDTQGREVTTNRMMSLLKLERDDGTAVGMINWYAIHGTSIWQNNLQLSGDNKGYAGYRFEQDFTDMNPDFLAGFMQADEGDASPNLFIVDLSEAELRNLDSDGFQHRAGGRTEAENALIAGYKQYRRARDLYDAAEQPLVGGVGHRSILVDFSSVQVDAPRDYPAALQPDDGVYAACTSALGVSFAGGAEDGRGPTAEGQTCTDVTDLNAIVELIEENFAAGSAGAIPPGLIVPVGCNNPAFDLLGYACHAEKPIIFPLGLPSPFLPTQSLEPQTVQLQVITIGNLAIVAVPWEVTTMSGRRIRTAVLDTLDDAGIDYAVISGLSNGFVHYLTTREEYSQQYYEGASTVFGPWSQEALTQELERIALQLRNGEPASSPYADPAFRSQLTLMRNPMLAADGTPAGAFGDVTTPPDLQYQLGDERIEIVVEFAAGHPRNDMRLDASLLYVERQQTDGSWTTIRTDADWFTRFEYVAAALPTGENHARVTWIVEPETEPGIYRIRHAGASGAGPYEGITDVFELLPCDDA